MREHTWTHEQFVEDPAAILASAASDGAQFLRGRDGIEIVVLTRDAYADMQSRSPQRQSTSEHLPAVTDADIVRHLVDHCGFDAEDLGVLPRA